MSKQRDDDDSEEETQLPTFSGYSMPTNINVDGDDDIGEETTRRIGGATFNPTFEPVQTFSPNIAPMEASSVNRVQQKAAAPIVLSAPAKSKTSYSSISGGWNLNKAPTLPTFHPLDRASVFCNHTSVSLVAGRIANTLKDRSIEAHFDNTKAKVRCLTSYNVDFRIFLYRGQKRYSHGVIVEVQRRYGASVLFFQDSQAILDAAQGKTPAPVKSLTTAEIPLVTDTEDEFDDSKAALSSLSFVEKMLMYDRLDATLLGLQTLSSLTDPAKMGKNTAIRVSEAIVADGNVVGGKVFEVITARSVSEETEVHYDLAMSITANVLRNVGGKISSFHRDAIRPILIRDMENAEKKPQRAFAAARCLDSLLASDKCATDLYIVLEHCKDVGEARHSALRVQAEKCIRLIDQSR